MEKMKLLKQLKESEKEYSITLEVGELELIRRLLCGYGELERCLFELDQYTDVTIQCPDELGEGVIVDDLEEKIFKQYYDEDGKLR